MTKAESIEFVLTNIQAILRDQLDTIFVVYSSDQCIEKDWDRLKILKGEFYLSHSKVFEGS